MCVYLAPRWRRRSLVLLAMALLPLMIDARTLRKLNVGTMTRHASPQSTSGNKVVGVVTPDSMESSTTLTTRAWNTGNGHDTSQHGGTKSVSFNNLVRTPTTPAMAHNVMEPAAYPSQRGPLDNGSNNAGSPSTKSNRKTDKTPFVYTPSTVDPALSPAHSSPAPLMHPDSLEAPTSSSTLNTENHSETQSAGNMESDSSTATSMSLEHMVVLIIIGVVGSIGVLLVIASRKVLEECDNMADSM